MTMRNFWIEGQVDGRKSEFTGGPRCKNGGFDLDINMRDNGLSINPITVKGYVNDAGHLILEVLENQTVLFHKETKR